ncbi:hypothetical protein GQ53DRAFT_745210 [Thozetella sp. PMI_491]|nr:hypothetical protein GQ53DRAFT_745210 [Thozetella sp. PMI_491]
MRAISIGWPALGAGPLAVRLPCNPDQNLHVDTYTTGARRLVRPYTRSRHTHTHTHVHTTYAPTYAPTYARTCALRPHTGARSGLSWCLSQAVHIHHLDRAGGKGTRSRKRDRLSETVALCCWTCLFGVLTLSGAGPDGRELSPELASDPTLGTLVIPNVGDLRVLEGLEGRVSCGDWDQW